jgi:hypothetical protein
MSVGNAVVPVLIAYFTFAPVGNGEDNNDRDNSGSARRYDLYDNSNRNRKLYRDENNEPKNKHPKEKHSGGYTDL